MELVLVRLQVSKLSELLAAVIKSASKWLYLLVDNFVCPHISTLREGLATDVALVWTLSSVTSLMSL
jgi:hypothetical protein